MPLTDAERSLRSSIGANARWARANKAERSRVAQAGHTGLLERFAREIDPDGILEPDERAKRARYAFTAHMKRLALRSSQARRSAA